MKNALILHGTGNNSKGNWFPWLKRELEKKSWKVWVPDLPQADKPNMKRYNKFLLKENNWGFNKKSVLIGHSSGAVAILGLLQALPDNIEVDTCILVGSFKNDLNYPALKNFFVPLDFDRIRKKSRKFIFLHSGDDPYCPLEHAEFLAEKVGGKLIVKKGQGHFNLEKGSKFKKLPIILEMLE
jgi:predicted alpha/beta hydrolase family esterase